MAQVLSNQHLCIEASNHRSCYKTSSFSRGSVVPEHNNNIIEQADCNYNA